ncbi:hypothetical protein KJ693_09880 [bacterium]|nr:hypothetical protein [bacterium]MBU1615600.1 hypothetical protein [bacterium]
MSKRRRLIRAEVEMVDLILFNPDNPVRCLPSNGVNLRPIRKKIGESIRTATVLRHGGHPPKHQVYWL